jgi:hypothetical protein
MCVKCFRICLGSEHSLVPYRCKAPNRNKNFMFAAIRFRYLVVGEAHFGVNGIILYSIINTYVAA